MTFTHTYFKRPSVPWAAPTYLVVLVSRRDVLLAGHHTACENDAEPAHFTRRRAEPAVSYRRQHRGASEFERLSGMNRCHYCGLENADAAPRCTGCGTE